MKPRYCLAHMKTAYVYAELSYCKKHQVGCVIVKENRIISIGFNGTPPGWENNCEDENGKTRPEVYHAEANAIAKLAKSVESGKDASLFVTTMPCFDCAKLISQTGIKEVFYSEPYKNTEGIEFLKKCNIAIHILSKNNFLKFSLKKN